MMVSMETYLRRRKRDVQRLLLDSRIRGGGLLLFWGGCGFLFSAASVLGYALPMAMGLCCALSGWQAVFAACGALIGYPVFWGMAGSQGICWSAAGGILGVLLGNREEKQTMPIILPALAALLTAITGVIFQFLLKDKTPVMVFLLRVVTALLTGMLFTQALSGRDAVTDWLVGGTAVFALAQVAPRPWLSLGYPIAGLLAVGGAFPAAALAGLGLDLAQVTALPMTAIMSIAYFLRMLPFDKRWKRCACPCAACLATMILCGIRDPTPLPGLLLGGIAGMLLPPRTELHHRRGETGAAQVKLEMGAEVMASTGRMLAEMEPPPIDEFALLEKVRSRACESCSARRSCSQKDLLTRDFLQNPLDADCRKPGRLIPELHRAQDQLRYLKADRQRRQDYRSALMQQYRFFGDYLRSLADRLPHRGEDPEAEFRIQVSARSHSKERANGDRCLAFSGGGCRYYVLLCDGMGTGLGAAQEGTAAAKYLRQMLLSGFPAQHALRSYNSFLALRGSAGAVTVDLAEVRLDTGIVTIFKWGAAPSWVLTRKGAEKIGTATPPPGISVTEIRETVEKLSLRRGEVLVLLSDGVDGEVALRQSDLTPDWPPGELAAKILESGRGKVEDDATAAVIRLRPTGLPVS